MQYDMCLKCESREVLTAALLPLSLAAPDGDLITAGHDHALQYMGRVAQTPAEVDAEGNMVADPVFYDGEYAILRAEADLLDRIVSTSMVGVEIVAPPAGLPTFGDWRARPTVDLDALKAGRIAEAAAACEAVLVPYGARFCRSERDTWTEQVQQAQALLSDPTLETPEPGEPDMIPLLRAITTQTGESLPALAMAINTNREAWLILSGVAIGQRQSICDRINSAATHEEVAAVGVTIRL